MRKTWIAVLTIPLGVAVVAGPAGAAPRDQTAPNEHVTITFSISSPQSPGTVVATGPIVGSGTATATKGRHIGRVHLAVETLTFGSNTVKVRAIRVRGTREVDASTCTATENGKGAFLLAGGTGAYAHATGRGTFTVTSTIVGAHDSSSAQGCSFKSPTGTTVVDATGHVSI